MAIPTHSADLSATLDREEITLVMDHPAVIHAALQNKGQTPICLTGIKVQLSEGATGKVYNPNLLHERLRELGAGQTWDGPLAVIRANHRGPLVVKGSLILEGGSGPDASGILAAVPLHVTIDDPRRQRDGSYDRSAKPACDRPADYCCDSSEAKCFQLADRCIYVAEGYDRQQVCVNHQAEKSYEHVTDLRVSSDGVHIAYLASFHCVSKGSEELCQRVSVTDRIERPITAIVTHLDRGE